MATGRRWMVRDHYGNDIYLSDERWGHIIEPTNHPEMSAYEEHLQETIQTGRRKQDSLDPQKYRYSKAFDGLVEDNTHIIAIVIFRLDKDPGGVSMPNNYVVTAYQKEMG